MAEALDTAGERVYRVELDRDGYCRAPFTGSQFGSEAVEPGLFRHVSPKPCQESRGRRRRRTTVGPDHSEPQRSHRGLRPQPKEQQRLASIAPH